MLRRKLMWVLMPAVMGGLILVAGCHRPTPEKIASHIVEEVADELKLDAAQMQQLNAIKNELLVRIAEMKQTRESVHGEMLAELQKDTIDADRLKKIAATRQQEMHVLVDLAIDRLAAFHATLNPEQKKKLVQLIKDKQKSHKWGRFAD